MFFFQFFLLFLIIKDVESSPLQVKRQEEVKIITKINRCDDDSLKANDILEER
jgi:hypothetical protein